MSLIFFISVLQAQTIKMNFPAFAGKSYDFIIFQGSNRVTAQQGIIPPNGKFLLKVPEKYAPYTGMCRWLITKSKDGGGLDMAIPGKGYSVTCLAAIPNNSNIVYKGYDPVNELNRLADKQEKLLSKYEAVTNAMRVYDKKSELYKLFSKEQKRQIQAYQKFHEKLKTNTNYNARFLPIVNLTRGIPNKLSSDYRQNALFNAEFIADELNFDELYTSGHWAGIISSWVLLHTQALEKDSLILPHFIKISERVNDPKKYTDLVERITYYLDYYGKNDYISLLAPVVLNSGKITQYTGKLSVYQKMLIGMQAPPLLILSKDKKSKKTTITELPSFKFAEGNVHTTFLVFYEAGCGHCEQLLGQLPGNYNNVLKKKGYDVITISADIEQRKFENTARAFPWKRTYCDFKGLSGTNFVNYLVAGTPSIFAIDKHGKIVGQMATMGQILDYVKRNEKKSK